MAEKDGLSDMCICSSVFSGVTLGSLQIKMWAWLAAASMCFCEAYLYPGIADSASQTLQKPRLRLPHSVGPAETQEVWSPQRWYTETTETF